MRERYTGAVRGKTMVGTRKRTLGGTVNLNEFLA